MSMKLSDKAIKRLPTKDKPYEITDTEVSGLSIRVSHDGKKFSARLSEHGKQFRRQIGVFGEINTEEARKIVIDKRRRYRQRKALQGQMPEAAHKSMMVSDLWVMYREQGMGHKSPRTILLDEGRARVHILPFFNDMRVVDLTATDIRLFIDAVQSGKTAEMANRKREEKNDGKERGYYPRAKGGDTVAKSCVALLSAMLTFAVEREIIEKNVAMGIKKPPTKRRKRYLSKGELATFGQLLKTHRDTSPKACDIITLLLLTGCRLNEIATVQWDYIDFEAQVIRLPHSKVGERDVYVGMTALDYVKNITKHESPYVFPSEKAIGKNYTGTESAFKRMRDKSNMQHFAIHDFRRTYATVGKELGYGGAIVRDLLGHSDRTMTDGYMGEVRDELIVASNEISRTIMQRLDPSARHSEHADNNNNEVQVFLQKIGHDIQYHRHRKGISSEEMTERCGFSHTTLKSIEQGRGLVAIEHYFKALSVLGLLNDEEYAAALLPLFSPQKGN